MKPAELERELTRQLQEDEALSSLVATLRDQAPDASELASLASRLHLQGISLVPTAAKPRWAWMKWLAPGGVGVALLAAWASSSAPTREAAVRGSETPPPLAAVMSASPGQRVLEAPAPSLSAIGQRAAVFNKSPVLEASQSPAAASSVRAVSPEPVSASSPAAQAPAELSARSASAARVRSTKIALAPAPPEGSSASASGAHVDDAPSELELLRDARLALKQSPGRALELTQQHSQLYPGGALTQERELLAISALVALGRRTAALTRAAAFERNFGASPYRKQLNELLR